MKFPYQFIALLSFSATSLASDPGWVDAGTTSDGNTSYSIKQNSITHDSNKKGDPITVAVVRSTSKNSDKIDIKKWYVSDRDCDNEYGRVIVLSMGDEFFVEAPYAKGSKALASNIAEIICIVGQRMRSELDISTE